MSADAPAIPAAELSGEKVTLISKTNSKFEIPREVAEMSELVKNSLVSKGGEEEDTDEDSDEGSSEDGDGGGGSASQEVPVRVVDDACLAKAIKFMEYHRTNPLAPAEKPIVSNNIEDIFQDPFDREFVAVDSDLLRGLIQAAEFLQIPSMLDLCVVKAATMIKDHTREEIDEAFGIEGELTPEEESRVYAENPWLKDM